ncbi:hypothetical protein [Neotabrizicola sp. sgz301269]|uniref:hypothetical protein n=1 Tax=Neotabrizicola sp. sgz301269 TaxID=3276282 RepID=UPI00376FC71C
MDDHTKATALQLAKLHLEKWGHKYTPRMIGETAREILDGLAEGNPKMKGKKQ